MTTVNPQYAPLTQRTLIAGAGEGGKLLAAELRGSPGWGFEPVCFVDDDPAKQGLELLGLPVVGSMSDIPSVVERYQIGVVVIAVPSAPEITLGRIAAFARNTPAQVMSMPSIGALLRGVATTKTLKPFDVHDVLGRPVVLPQFELCREMIAGRRVLVTGAAGSIGRELTRQVAQLEPATLLGLDNNESELFDVEQEHRDTPAESRFIPLVASVTNRRKMESVFTRFKPEIVFHAAAFKHVPMMERYPDEAVFVNTISTYELAEQCAASGVDRLVLVSTDKAVRPSSVMGASKRLAEIAIKAVARERGLSACAVRFGNVLGSRGSVIPLFEKQIAAGGPVTVTDERMMRYFMTIPEAASLIIHAGAFADSGVIYMLDMGDEVSILDLARRMIQLHGMREGRDIQIRVTGLRPGEKLREDLSNDFEAAEITPHAKIRILKEAEQPWGLSDVRARIDGLRAAAIDGEPGKIREAVMQCVRELDDAVGSRCSLNGHSTLAEAAMGELVTAGPNAPILVA